MRAAEHWKDFEVLDTSGGEKLERWGNVILTRPDPQIIWNTPKGDSWKKINARYLRSRSGGGSWEVRNMPAGSWTIGYRELTFKIQPTGFKHTGLFPEQAVNWDFMAEKIRAARKRTPTGRSRCSTSLPIPAAPPLPAAAAGASVCHVDASKGMVAWARENAALSGLENRPIRWIVDDCLKFVGGRSVGATGMTASSWTRPPMDGARAVRSGSWRSRSIHWWRKLPSCSMRTPLLPAQLLYHRTFGFGDGVYSGCSDPGPHRRTGFVG